MYCFRDLGPRTSRAPLLLQGLRVPRLRVRMYCFRNFGSPDFVSACTPLGTLRMYSFRDFGSPDFASALTASGTSGSLASCPHVLLQGLRVPRLEGLHVPGLRVRIYCFRDFGFPDFVSACTPSGTLRMYSFRDFGSPDFASAFTASGTSSHQTSCPHLLLQGLRVPGLRVRMYCFRDFGFPDFVSACTPSGTLRMYSIRDFGSADFASAFSGSGTSSPRTSCPHLLL
ncbi:hypothetical protein CDL15_Pgr002666 [Punica granatum]|uniref:Uncharacterized protein n=1 Tax=Punica granatum TaxID=22663 RepID=A0A218WU73_PUNGR|nr:hypothetical protein CDL15_Pgr002666 [Punica granatum]